MCNTIDNALSVEIDGFLTEGALARVKGCRVGDRVHSVNGEEMHHVRFNKVVAILKEKPFPLTVSAQSERFSDLASERFSDSAI